MISITFQSTFLIWSITCTLILLTTKSLKNQFNSKRICSQIRSIRIKMISISLSVNIVEKSTRVVEMNFAIQINFELLDSRKNALYMTNTIADQSITSKRSEMTWRSDFRIIILSRDVATHNTEDCESRVLMIKRSQR